MIDVLNKLNRSLQKSKLVSKQEGAPNIECSISRSSARNTCIVKQNLYHVLIDYKKAVAGYGMPPYCQL